MVLGGPSNNISKKYSTLGKSVSSFSLTMKSQEFNPYKVLHKNTENLNLLLSRKKKKKEYSVSINDPNILEILNNEIEALIPFVPKYLFKKILARNKVLEESIEDNFFSNNLCN